MFLDYKDLIKTSEYWIEVIQNELYSQVQKYLTENKITQTQLAEQLGVSKGYISQILNGNFNHTLKKLVELSLAIGKVPILDFLTAEDWENKKQEKLAHSRHTTVIIFETNAGEFSKVKPQPKTNFSLPGKHWRHEITIKKEISCAEFVKASSN